MTGPMRSTLTLLSDSTGGAGGSPYAAVTWNTPYLQVADLFDSHVLAASQNGATVVKHIDSDIAVTTDYPQVTARSVVVTELRDAVDQLMAAWVEVVGASAHTFRSATVPTTIAALNTAVGAPTNANTINQIVKRDGNGDFAARNITANSFVGLCSIAAAVTDRALGVKSLGSLAWSGTGVSNTLTTVLDGSYVNASGVLITVVAGTTIALTPSASGSEWQVVYFGETGVASTATGTVGGARTTAVLPTTAAYQPVWVFLPQNCTGVYSTKADWVTAGSPVAKGYIDDRPLPAMGVPGAGGGGGGATITFGAVIAAAGASTGTMLAQTGVNSAANLLDVLAGNGGTFNGQNTAPGNALRVTPKLVRMDANAPGADDLFNTIVQADMLTNAHLSVSGAQATLTGTTGNPLVLTAGGYMRKITTTLAAASASGLPAGVVYLVADLTGATPALSFQTSPGSAAAGVRTVAKLPWDGTTLINRPDYGFLASVPASAVGFGESIQVTDVFPTTIAAQTVTSSVVAFTGMNTATFRLANTSRLLVHMRLTFDVTVGTADRVYVAPLLDGAQAATQNGRLPRKGYGVVGTLTEEYLDLVFITGLVVEGLQHTLTAGCFKTATGGTSSISLYGNFCEITAIPFRST